jgi:hypothetical protein
VKGLILLVLRGMEAGIDLAGRTLAGIPGRLADRLDPPPRLSLLIDQSTSVRARAMAEDPDAYWEQVHAERAAEVQERRP